mmetsp:Transcript_11070/g.24387  ORF Transcript_11070/g.24387 Transcript_11070/m.24387 type:complete len:119 (-) Transcript_11070:188-544(-)
MITTGNRQQFIADGLHYELVSTLAQETAQDMMRRTFHLEWITICDDDAFGEHTSKSAGVKADTDTFWEHRFGKIKTLWAGTADHALSNWAAHEPIWRHFGQHLSVDDGNDDINEKCLD